MTKTNLLCKAKIRSLVNYRKLPLPDQQLSMFLYFCLDAKKFKTLKPTSGTLKFVEIQLFYVRMQ